MVDKSHLKSLTLMHATSICPSAACSSGFAHRHAAVRLPQICNHHPARWHLFCTAARTSADDLDPLYGDESTCPVPLAQQPAHQLQQLQQVPIFAWATRPVDQWLWQIGLVWLASAILLGLPISRSSFPHEHQLAQCLLSSSIGGLLVVTGVVARLWLGFQYVCGRLSSAVVPYEESGWYDGQVWTKPASVLTRDRLMASYSVRPIIARLQRTLLFLGGLISQGSASEVEQSLPVSEQPSLSATGQTSEYWDRVQQFEPWVLRGEERPGTDHMRAHGLRDGPVIHYSS